MAHFAKLNSDNEVTHVSVVDDWNITDGNGQEQESVGVAYLHGVHGVQEGTTWKQTSYNATFRKNYAGIGFKYDAGRDAFISPKPYASWLLDETTCRWKAPVDMPTDGHRYLWNEENTNWEQVSD